MIKLSANDLGRRAIFMKFKNYGLKMFCIE